MTTYTTIGPVRGQCGHNHRSIETAQRCLQADQDGCGRQGGYSDRRIVAIVDGERQELTEEDYLYSLDVEHRTRYRI